MFLLRLRAELEEERESHTLTRHKLAEASADLSQSTMMDLELADYQRTLDNLNRNQTELQEETRLAHARGTELEVTVTALRKTLAESKL